MATRKLPETAIRYVNFLRQGKPGVIGAYLFGSYAKGTEGLDSDIDVAIIFDDFTDAFDMRVDLMKLRRKFDTKIEPHPFRKADFNAANPIIHRYDSNTRRHNPPHNPNSPHAHFPSSP